MGQMGLRACRIRFPVDMAPKAMKAMKAAGKPLSKGGLADAIATETELKKKDCMKVLDSLAAVATAGEERGEGDDSWTLYGEDAPETRDQGGQARGLRQGGLRQGQACQDGGEGLLRGSPQEEHLSFSPASSP